MITLANKLFLQRRQEIWHRSAFSQDFQKEHINKKKGKKKEGGGGLYIVYLSDSSNFWPAAIVLK